MSKYKLVCLDLDGTLLNSKRKISEDSLRMLRKAEQSGMEIAVATGRIPADAHAHAGIISDRAYFIGNNGSVIGRVGQETWIEEKTLSKDFLVKLMKLADHWSIKPLFAKANGIIVHGFFDYVLHKYFEGKTDGPRFEIEYVPQWKELKKLVANRDHGIHKVTFFVLSQKKLRLIKKQLRAIGAEVAVVNRFWLEITERGTNKSWGIRYLADHLNIESKAILAFGDSENDLEMLRYAGCGVAMGNANDKIKAAADMVAESNDRNGVARVLELILE